MSRFRDIVKYAWLLCKRNGVHRDLRVMMCTIVSRRVFDWESEELRKERAQRWNLRCIHQESRVYYLCQHIAQVVEKCSKLPFGAGEDALLRLQRVTLRLQIYSPPNPYWRWLH